MILMAKSNTKTAAKLPLILLIGRQFGKVSDCTLSGSHLQVLFDWIIVDSNEEMIRLWLKYRAKLHDGHAFTVAVDNRT